MKKMNLLRMNLQYFAEDSEPTNANSEGADDNPAGSEQNEHDEHNEQPDPRSVAKYSDADLDRIISKKLAAERKKQDEAARLSRMTAEEKAAEETRQLREELNSLKAANARAGMMREARSLLKDKGIVVGDELLGQLIAEDADTTKESIESFVELFNSAVEAKVKEALKGNTPRATDKQSAITKEQIMAVKNTLERQKLIREHQELFR